MGGSRAACPPMVQLWCTLELQLGLTHTQADGGLVLQVAHTLPLGCHIVEVQTGHAAGGGGRLGLQGSCGTCWQPGHLGACTHLGQGQGHTPVLGVPANNIAVTD